MKMRRTTFSLVCLLLISALLIGSVAQASTQVPYVTGNIAVAGDFTMAVQEDGTLRVWTGDAFRSGVDHADYELLVRKLEGIIAVAAGAEHALALAEDGVIFAWGLNDDGQLGNGTYATPIEISGARKDVPGRVLTRVAAIAAGDNHSLAIREDGGVWAWGQNGSGQLGDGTASKNCVPVQVLNQAVAIAAGAKFSLAVDSEKTLWGWGANSYGQLARDPQRGEDGLLPDGILRQYQGDENNGPQIRVPTPILEDVIAIAAGGSHSLALRSDGSLWAWGKNDVGQVGDGGSGEGNYQPQPTQILSDVVGFAAGSEHSLALRADGSLWAWGYNGDLQFGDYGFSSTTPRQVLEDMPGIATIAAGFKQSAIVLEDGRLFNFGLISGVAMEPKYVLDAVRLRQDKPTFPTTPYQNELNNDFLVRLVLQLVIFAVAGVAALVFIKGFVQPKKRPTKRGGK